MIRNNYTNNFIDRKRRYQNGLTLANVFPHSDNHKCACGCGRILSGRKRRWATSKCQGHAVRKFFIIKGDSKVIREELFSSDKGICQICFKYDKKWEADHIIPVCLGGGGCDINNFQTLCKKCHEVKSLLYQTLSHHRVISWQASAIRTSLLWKEFGAVS